MLSLIEDQVMQLKSLSIQAEMFHANISTQETNRIQQVCVWCIKYIEILNVI